ncbi:hypothetical protein AMATHDRAFT_60706 [Amanita thiersii Skay4041]|uniref:RRM domain-containing protein n=1 Tax=Amanita thiersii Skay4041 TaxID=703135 RepID=A0A2A9NHZ3_9AGAR|nr:hypothetical protein AMATHDRAFT_60706 [Amanita thiersii Skay4041]
MRQNSFPKFRHLINSVKIHNISSRASKREIVALFNTLIGEVCSSREIKDRAGYGLEITFCSQDAATKALCMSGYTISGTPLKVTPITPHDGDSPDRSQKDDRRNLYVLGLPFSLTKAELFNMFSCYGIVTHCVILATVDNSSRRRGFVVMSSHEEAKRAMTTLTSTQLKGHALDISWAVVQRSQGFLDGGDRSMALDSKSSSQVNFRRNNSVFHSTESPNTSVDSNDLDLSSLAPSSNPTPTLLVFNLPTLLFSQPQDLRPLFYPFGPIKKLEVLEHSSTGSVSVIVDYANTAAAREAKDTLNGQCYANFRVGACYLRSALPTSHPHMPQTLRPNHCGLKNNAALIPCYEHFLPQGLTGQYYDTESPQIPSAPIDTVQPNIHAIHHAPAYHQPANDCSRCSSASSREAKKQNCHVPLQISSSDSQNRWNSDTAISERLVLNQLRLNNHRQSH